MALSNEQILAELVTIFQEVLDDNTIKLKEATTANDVAEWDSVNHLVLLHAIEQKFNLKFTLEEMIAFKNVGDIVNCISIKSTN